MNLSRTISTILYFFALAGTANSQSYHQILKQLPHEVNGEKQVLPQAWYSNISPSHDDILKIKRRKLIVVLSQPSVEMQYNLRKKPDLLDTYNKGIESTNANMRAFFLEFWPNSDSVEYKTIQEISSITNKSDYLVAFCYSISRSTNTLNIPIYTSTLGFSVSAIKEDIKHNYDLNNNFTQVAIASLEDNVIIYSQIIPDLFPLKNRYYNEPVSNNKVQ